LTATVALAAGCGGDGKVVSTPSEEDAGPDIGPDVGDVGEDADAAPDADAGSDADADVDPPPQELIGQLNVSRWQADALYDYPELHSTAVFSPALAEAGVENALGWLVRSEGWPIFLPLGHWSLPAVGEAGPMQPATVDGFGLDDVLDAGIYVTVGEHSVAHVDENILAAHDTPVYLTLQEDAFLHAERQDPAVPMDLEIDGGQDISRQALEAAVTLPEPLEITSHDTSQLVPVRRGKDVVVEWTPSADPDDTIVLTAETWDDAHMWRVEDTGRANLSELMRQASIVVRDAPTFSITRLLEDTVQLREGRLKVVSTARQWLYGKRVKPWKMDPFVWPAGTTTEVELNWWDGAVRPNELVFDLPAGVSVQNIRMLDTAHHRIGLTVEVDADAELGAVGLSFVDDTGRAVNLDEAAWVAASLPASGDCQSALDEGPLADGTYFATNDGLSTGAFATDDCPLGDPTGREQVIPLHMKPGQTLHARLLNQQSLGTMYIVGDCNDTLPVYACTMSPRKERAATLSYTAYYEEDILLVVDSYGTADGPTEHFAVDIRRGPQQPFVVAPPVVTGGARSEELEVVSLAGDFDASTASFDFGADVTVENIDVAFADTAYVTVSVATPLTNPGPQDVATQISGVDYTVPGALTLRPWLNPQATCQDAAALTPLGEGEYEGLTSEFLGSQNTVSVESCLGQTADAPEAIFPVELGPSQTLRARVDMPGADPVLYLLEACDGAVLQCADDRAPGDPEYLEYTGPPQASTVYLVVDGYGATDTGVYYLNIDFTL
jgi:hypothetical protein